MPNDLTDVVTTRVDLVARGAVRDPDDKSIPARFLLYKAEGGGEPAKGQPGGVCALCNGEKTIRGGKMKCPACGGTGVVPAGGPLNKAEGATEHSHPQGDDTLTHSHTAHDAEPGHTHHEDSEWGAAGPMNSMSKAEKFDPDGDGDDDSSPETDTDHDFWTAAGKPIAAAWKAAGKPVPIMKSEHSWDHEWLLATDQIQKTDNDPNVGGGIDRDKLSASAFAGPNRSFPIVKPGDVSDAASSLGRAGSDATSAAEKTTLRARIKAAIIRIAKSKGAAFVAQLPAAWTETAKTEKTPDPATGANGGQSKTQGDPHMPDPEDDKNKTGAASTEINKADLPPEVRALLEKADADNAALRGELDATKNTLAETSKIAKEEQDFRLNATYIRKAETLDRLPLTFDVEAIHKAEGDDAPERTPQEMFAGALRELHEKAPGAEAILMPILQTANTVIAKGDFFKEFGSGGSGDAASPLGRIKAITSQIQKDEKGPNGSALSEAQAYDMAIQRNPDLYEQSRALPEVGAGRQR